MATKIHKGGYVDVRAVCPQCGIAHSILAVKADQDMNKAEKGVAKCPMCGASFETPILFIKRTKEDDAADNTPNS